jgi:glutathione peroxidase
MALALALAGAAASARVEAPAPPSEPSKEAAPMTSIYDFTMKDIDGEEVTLSAYKGKVLLLVNTASRCGYTPQYEGLQKLYEKYMERGFVVLGFPANNFLGQEPGTNAEIKQFCSAKFAVTFPMFAKISVKGDDQAPLYTYLTDKRTNPQYGGEIGWNFNKFLVGRDGKIVNRWGSKTAPENKDLVEAVEAALAAMPPR